MAILVRSVGPFDGSSTTHRGLEAFLSDQCRLPVLAKDLKYHRDYDAFQKLPTEMRDQVKGLIHRYRKSKNFLKEAYNAVANVKQNRRASSFLQTANIELGAGKKNFADWFFLDLVEWEVGPIMDRTQTTRGQLWTKTWTNHFRDIRFYCSLPYELRLTVGKGPVSHDVGTQVAKGQYKQTFAMKRNKNRWFKYGCYVPRAMAQRGMNTHAYQTLIGYGGETGSKDHIWHMTTSERAKQAGKVLWPAAGLVIKAGKTLLGGPGGSMPTGATPPHIRRQYVDEPDQGADWFDNCKMLWNGSNHLYNRKSFPPQGYVFVKFNAALTLSVYGVGW